MSLNPIALGQDVQVAGVAYTLVRYIDLYSVLAVRGDTGERVRLAVADLLEAKGLPDEANDDRDSKDSSGFERLTESQWQSAQERAALVAPLLASPPASRAQAELIAAGAGVHVATLYRWANRLRATGQLADLAPSPSNGGRGKLRINKLSEDIVAQAIEEQYLTKQRKSVAVLMRDIQAKCRRAGLPPPHPNTVRRRIHSLSERVVLERRMGRKAADDRFAARPGQFPGADYPGAYWQIDHTPLDVVVVDDVHRRHIGRPWLTLAIDVFSRCVAGFYLSLDPPNEVSVGMCLVHAMLPKDGWMRAINAQGNWPMWGTPQAVHADNGKEFHGAMISRAAEQYRFRLEWRKVKTPNWGGHIERLMGTFSQEVHTLPGTTFSNTQDRGTYAPHEEAVLTFEELERYLTEYICGVYHQKPHSGIGRPPIRRYEYGLLGDGTVAGRGLPHPPADPTRLRLDFMPLIERSVQRYGLQIDGIFYYHPVLDPWVRAKAPDGKSLRRFIIRRDPRDISVVYFLDPASNRYVPVTYRQTHRPNMSLWELREVKAQLKREGREEADEDLIFDTYERLSRLVEEAQAHTVKARKAAQKKRSRPSVRGKERAQEGLPPPLPELATESGWDDADDVTPFSVIKVK